MTAIAVRYDALSHAFDERVRAVGVGGWDVPTPCQGWTARDLLRHVIDVHRMLPAHGRSTVTLETSVDTDPVGAWTEARQAVQAVLDDPQQASAEFDGFFGRTRVDQSIDTFLCFDLVVHGWDLARATGQDETMPPDEVRRLLADAQRWGPAIRSEGVFGPEVEVAGDASEQDKLLAFLGRTP